MGTAVSVAGSASTVLTESITVTGVSSRTAELCLQPASAWTEDDLSHYILEEIERLHGPQLPNQNSARILQGFWRRFGTDGARIARSAFESRRGMWMGAPVTIRRFAESHDGFFSLLILKELDGAS